MPAYGSRWVRLTLTLKLKIPPSPGKAFSVEEQERMLAIALASTQAAQLACTRQVRGEKPVQRDKQGGSPSIDPVLALALNCGMRDAEIGNLTWAQINFDKQILTVGRSKTDAGTGRTIPLNGTVLQALVDHTGWYKGRFGEIRAAWFVFLG